ncbi:MAG: cation transporter [Clostridia bacterium]|nr:cation transporter [Clostridia bacterium]
MLKFFFSVFKKNHGDIQSATVRESYGTLAGIFGIITNLILFVIKLVIGILSGSISILADAINNLADSGSSILTIIGFKLSSKPADKEHPYGHERMEYLTGLGISVLILIIGFELLTTSFKKLFSPELPNFSNITFIVLFISILLKLFQGLFYKRVGKIIKSDTLIAAYTDSFNDVISTTAVLISTIVSFFSGIILDGFIGIGVSLFIIYSGIKLIVETANPLIGTVPDCETVNRISEKIKQYDVVLGIHDLVIHSYGANKCFASVHVEVDANSDISVVHDTIDLIERDFMINLGISLVIHMDPIITNSPEVEAAKSIVTDIINNISQEITMHDFRVVFGDSHTNLIFDVCIPFSFELSERELTEKISSEVSKIHDNWFTVITVDRDYNRYNA